MENTEGVSKDQVSPNEGTPPENENVEWYDADYVDPVEKAEEEAPNDVYVDVVPKAPPVAQKIISGIDSVVASSETDDIGQKYAEGFLSENSFIADNFVKNVDKALSKPLKRLSVADPQEVAQDVSERASRAKNGGVLAKYYAYVDGMEGAENLSKKQRDEAAYKAYTQHQIAKIADESGYLGLAGDFAQSVFLSDNNYKLSELAEYFNLPFEAGDYIYTGDFIHKFKDAMYQLPPEARASIFQQVVDNWETIGGFDNKLDLITFLSRLENINEFEEANIALENVSDRLDQTLILKAAGNVIKTVAKGTSALSRIAKIGKFELARDVVKAGAAGALKEQGIDPLTAANAMTPFDTVKKLTVGAPDNIAQEVLIRDKHLTGMLDEFDPLDIPLTDAERQKKIDKVWKRLEEEPEITNIKIKERDNKSFTLEFDTTTGIKQKQVNFTLNDIGGWDELQQVSRVSRWIWSPNHLLPGIKEDLVQSPHFALLQGTRIRNSLDTAMKEAWGKLNKTESLKVDELLLKGDNNKVFSYTEAVEQGIGGVKYSEKEYKAYAATRQILDKMHLMKEKSILEGFRVRNVKQLTVGGSKTYGKVYDDVEAAVAAPRMTETKSKWYIKDDKLVRENLSHEAIVEAYQKGYKLVRADSSDFFQAGVSKAEWALVKADGIVEPTAGILNKIVGYVPKTRKGANFFLKKKVKTTVGDNDKVFREVTEAYSSNRKDLEKYLETLDDGEDYIIRADREMSAGELDKEMINISGGLYTGSRKSKDIPFIGSSKWGGARKTALESIQGYINNLASTMPISIYREGLKQKWINSAIEAGVIPENSIGKGFGELFNSINGMHPKARFFRNSHSEVAFVAGVRTNGEIRMQERLLNLGRYLENNGKIPWGKDLAELVYSDKLQNIPGIIKTITYHTMLGLYNPAQLYIQGSGMILAMSANPVHGMKGAIKAMEFTILDKFSRLGNVDQLAKAGYKFDVEAWKLWDKSGMKTGVISTNLDYSDWFQNVPYDAKWYKKALANSDLFVKMGEMSYSRVAFGTAYEYVKKQLGRLPTEADLEAIVARADQYRLNMSKANQAKFQRGLTSVPTQFMQVQTKFLEKVLGNDFTLAERLRIIGGQAILMGSVGVPIIGTISRPIMDYLGINIENTDADTLEILQKGALGYWVADGLEMNTDIGGRIALGNDIAERLINVIFSPSLPSTGELIAGPSWSVFSRIKDVWQRGMMVKTLAFSAEEVDDTTLLAATRVIAEEVLNIPATSRNILKAVVMANSKMYHNKAGLPIFHYRDTNFGAVLAQAMGFQNTEVSDWYELSGSGTIFNKPATQDNMAKVMASTMVKMINAGADKQMVYGAAYNALLTSVLQLKGGDKVLKKVQKYLETPGTTWHDQMKGALEKATNEVVDGLEEIMRRSNIRTNVTLKREMEKYEVEF